MTIDSVKFIEMVQKGDQLLNELLVDIPGLRVTNPYALADLIALNKGQSLAPVLPKPLERSKIKDLAIHFHSKAGTLTEGVLKNIELFSNEAPLLRIEHQANLFPSLNVFCQFIFQNLVAGRLESQHGVASCQIYVIVDHDAVEDRRFRVSHFPDIKRREGSLILSSNTPAGLRQKLNWAIDKPPKERIDEWISSLNILMKEDLSILRREGILERKAGQIDELLKEAEQEILECYNRASNLSEFNAILLSRIVNLHWKIPTIFLSSTQITPALENHYQYLLQHYPDIVKLANQNVDLLQSKGIAIPDSLRPRINIFPIWYVCQDCLVRVPLKVASKAKLNVTGECSICHSKYRFDLGTYSDPNLNPIWSKMAPRVIFNDLINVVGLGISGGVGYVRNAEHVVISSLVASKLGWNVPPECLWRTRGIYFGPAECEAALNLARENHPNFSLIIENVLRLVFFGRASILYYIFSQGIDGLIQMWIRHFENGGQVNEVNVGEGFFEVPVNLISLLEDKMRLINPDNTVENTG